MPQGNHHATPSGLWWQTPTKSSIPRLLGVSALKYGGVFLVIFGVQQYRSLAYTYTYTHFIGKTMTLGKLTTLTHEPLTTEEVDKWKRERSKSMSD